MNDEGFAVNEMTWNWGGKGLAFPQDLWGTVVFVDSQSKSAGQVISEDLKKLPKYLGFGFIYLEPGPTGSDFL